MTTLKEFISGREAVTPTVQDLSPQERAGNLAEAWAGVIQEFLKGDIEHVLDFAKNRPEMAKDIEYFNGKMIVMLRTALEKQRDDAMAYRLLVKFAHDAGVPLISGAGLEALKKLAADGQ